MPESPGLPRRLGHALDLEPDTPPVPKSTATVIVESSTAEPLERTGILGTPQALLALGRPGADGRSQRLIQRY